MFPAGGFHLAGRRHHKGREARNELVHEFTLGIEHGIENDDGRLTILKELTTRVKKIALADLVVCLLSLAATDEPLPRGSFISEYLSKVVSWVCDESE